MPRPRADSAQPESAFQANMEQMRNRIIALQNRFSRQFQDSTSGPSITQQQSTNETQNDSHHQKSAQQQLHVPLIFTVMNQLRPSITHDQVKALAVDLSNCRSREPVTPCSGHAPLIFTVMDQLHMKHPSVTHDQFKALAVDLSNASGRMRLPLLLMATMGLGFGVGVHASTRRDDSSLCED